MPSVRSRDHVFIAAGGYRYHVAFPCLLVLAGVSGYYAYEGMYILWSPWASALVLAGFSGVRALKNQKMKDKG